MADRKELAWAVALAPGDFTEEVAARCRQANRGVGLPETVFKLPLHVSLKKSFPVSGEYPHVKAAIEETLRDFGPVRARTCAPEVAKGMLWLPVEPVGDIARVHEELDRMLAERFGIGRHAFDRTFRPHVSLFTRGAAADMETVRGRLAHEIAPSEIVFSKFVIGSSVAGDTVVEFGN